jgi:hypothetical protein
VVLEPDRADQVAPAERALVLGDEEHGTIWQTSVWPDPGKIVAASSG